MRNWKNPKKTVSTQVGETWSWDVARLREKQWTPNCSPFFRVKQNSKALTVQARCSEERVNWVPNGGRWGGPHIHPYSRRASQQAKASTKKMEPLYFECVHVCISVHLKINRRDDYMKGNKKHRSHQQKTGRSGTSPLSY